MSTASDLKSRGLKATVRFLLFYAVMVFLPARTLNYWQGWLFYCLNAIAFIWSSVYFLKHYPSLVELRLKSEEKERDQKIIRKLIFLVFIALFIASGFDFRAGWSNVPAPVVLLGDLIYLVAFWGIARVFIENNFASAVVDVHSNQRVITTGPYKYVRHPMYTCALVLMVGIPLALGSYWALLFIVPMFAVLVWRLNGEESFLSTHLHGYPEYMMTTRYRLIPGIY